MHRLMLFSVFLLCGKELVRAEDWPLWRRDAARSAQSSEQLPDQLHLRWLRKYPIFTPTYREPRLQFDAGYEPVVIGKTMLIALPQADCLVALETANGRERWRFYVEGPIRLAPAAWRDRVFFGSDDGYFYCVSVSDGNLLWKRRAAPSQRKVLCNGRMISLWPVRGGPVVHEDRVYFAAGVWSMEGVFVYCLDAKTGNVVWRCDECSFVYGVHPHSAEALGGVTPQGYLVVALLVNGGADLIVPCGQAMPARLDLATGKLKSFELPRPGRRPGGWFASAAVRRGEITFDKEVNRDLHEDKVYQGPGSPGVRSSVTICGKSFRFGDGFPRVSGKIHSMLAAGGQLFVVDLDGRIYCFGEKTDEVIRHKEPTNHRPNEKANPAAQRVQQILYASGVRDGYAWLRGLAKYKLSEAVQLIDGLLSNSMLHLVVTDGNDQLLDRLRRRYHNRRRRICLLKDDGHLALPPYFASLIISDEWASWESLRPYGGVACLSLNNARRENVNRQLKANGDGEFSIERKNDWTIVRRGALTGASNYAGGWSSPDQRVKAPLGVLWFSDSLGHFKRSPQPWFVDGVMISYPKDWMEKHRANRSPPYDLLPPVFSDVYTGRVVGAEDAILADRRLPQRDLSQPEPNQYRPPSQRNAWKPKQPVIGERINPLTGEKEPRTIPKSYGCDGGVDYGFLYSMRSGAPSFYDKHSESGVCNIAGPRSGCTNSIIPACGVLNVPYFYEGCTCSYPLPVGLAMISMPPQHEQWSTWGSGQAKNVQRVGVNFGAPGDRVTPQGTLWLDYPNRGGPSPELSVTVQPKTAEYFYRHALFAPAGPGWPWVAASGVSGAQTITIDGLKPAKYSVRLYFAAPDQSIEPRHVFDVSLNGDSIGWQVELTTTSHRPAPSIVRELKYIQLDRKLQIRMTPRTGKTILCGVEIVADHLSLDPLTRR